MPAKKKTAKQNQARGSSRAAQNRKIRREALREELKSREYIRQIERIMDRLDPDAKDRFDRDDIPAVKIRLDGYFRLLDKTLPNLRPVELPLDPGMKLPMGDSTTAQTAAIVQAMAEGRIPPGAAVAAIQAVSGHLQAVSVEEYERRINALEAKLEALNHA